MEQWLKYYERKIFLTREIKYDGTDIIDNLEYNKKNCTYKFATLKNTKTIKLKKLKNEIKFLKKKYTLQSKIETLRKISVNGVCFCYNKHL